MNKWVFRHIELEWFTNSLQLDLLSFITNEESVVMI